MPNTIPHSISLQEAIDLTTRFRENRTANLALCETFDKNSIITMLSVPNSSQFRIYLGEKEDGKVCSVLVAADENGNDILPTVTMSKEELLEEDPLILEDAFRCPDVCPPPSPLNG